jgi:hypothetical protein
MCSSNKIIIVLMFFLFIALLNVGFVYPGDPEEPDYSDFYFVHRNSDMPGDVRFYLMKGDNLDPVFSQIPGVNPALEEEIKVLINNGDIQFMPHRDEVIFGEIRVFSKDLSIAGHYLENNYYYGAYATWGDLLSHNEIIIDKQGNIVDAYFQVHDSADGKVIINGNEFIIPKGEALLFEDGEFALPPGTKVVKASEDLILFGTGVEVFDELTFNGICRVTKKGYHIQKLFGDEISGTFQGVEFFGGNNKGLFIAKGHSLDLSNSKYPWIRKTEDELFVQGKKEIMRIQIKPESGFFDVSESEKIHGEKYLSMTLRGQDSFSLSKEKVPVFSVVPGNEKFEEVLTLKHNPSGKGSLDVYNGKQIFTFTQDGKFVQNFIDASKHYRLPVEMEIHSGTSYNPLEASSFDSPRYKVIVEDSGNAIFEDYSGFGDPKKIHYEIPEKDFGCTGMTKVGEEMCKCASELVGVGAFVKGGRGETCSIPRDGGNYDIMESPVEGVLMFDCIGVAIYCLGKIYPDTSLFDYSPDLRLVEDLEKMGWTSYMIEPGRIIGNENTLEKISKIPKGSILFTLREENSHIPNPVEGISSMKYTDSKGESYDLVIGHTLIKSSEDFKFVNANPAHKLKPDNALYESLIEYNIEQNPDYNPEDGRGGFYEGPVRIGDLGLKNEHGFLMVPPGALVSF